MKTVAAVALALGLSVAAFGQATAPAVIMVDDKAAIEAAMPKDITVQGVVSKVDTGGAGANIQFKGAEGTGFNVFIASRNLDGVTKALGGDLSKALEGKTIKVTGKMQVFREKPELTVTKADQIVVVPDAK